MEPTWTLEAFCKTCGDLVARAKGVKESEKQWHIDRAPLVFVCKNSPSHNRGPLGDFRFTFTEEAA